MSISENFDSIYGETIDTAIKTGFLFSYSLNYYENHTREEILTQGYSEDIVECAERVLAHFGTSVGAKEGKCPEELWCVRPCSDCHKPVDSREFNAVWRYGVELCEQCYDMREVLKQCFYCKSKYDDPAIENDFSGRCNQRYVPREKNSRKKEISKCLEEGLKKKRKRKIEHKYVCSWCALIEHCIKDYISNRIEDYGYEKGKDAAKLRIELEDFESYREGIKGIRAGEKWKDYYVEYDYCLYCTFDKPMTVEEVQARLVYTPYPLILHPKDTRKLFRAYRIRIFYQFSLAYLELSFGNKSSDAIINTINAGTIEAKPCKQEDKDEELKHVRNGLRLVNFIKETRGGDNRTEDPWSKFQPGEYSSLVDNRMPLIKVILEEYDRSKKGFLEMLKCSQDFKNLSQGIEPQAIEEVLKLIPTIRGNNVLRSSNQREYYKLCSPLAFACVLTAYEHNLVKTSGQDQGRLIKTTTLLSRYEKDKKAR